MFNSSELKLSTPNNISAYVAEWLLLNGGDEIADAFSLTDLNDDQLAIACLNDWPLETVQVSDLSSAFGALRVSAH